MISIYQSNVDLWEEFLLVELLLGLVLIQIQ